ncbi:DUF3631 domain-containing protein [Streptomyces celluloflavus]|uniref:DUF3631 domain-containing protein n=1 Tax=Streptomyces celluloflavus TaxID=58344 RepID=UPI0034617386|nr:DUF3631 domain-containing protein [Streptomyces celluloflavus]
MTTFPTLLDSLAALLETEPPPEIPHHRAILDAFTDIQLLDQQLLDLAERTGAPAVSATEQLETLTDLLVERLAAGHELARLLSTACCCASTADEDDTEDDFLSCPGERPQPDSIVHAALGVFTELGDPDAVASADLVAALRHLPGVAEDRWRYADLTQHRLAQLLAPYEVSTRDITLTDGRRRKSYRRGALLAALPAPSR